MAWQRNVCPLFTPLQIKVLSAVLLGIQDQDGKCQSFPYNSLAELLFSREPITKTAQVGRVRKTLDSSGVLKRLRAALERDVSRLSARADRAFVWMLKQRYPGGFEEVVEAIRNFERGGGLPLYRSVQVPREEIEPPKPKAKPSTPESKTAWNNMARVQTQETRAKRSFPAVRPRVAAPNSIFTKVQGGPAPYGFVACKPEAHAWEEGSSKPGKVVLTCQVCKAIGEVVRPDAQDVWKALQVAMAARGDGNENRAT